MRLRAEAVLAMCSFCCLRDTRASRRRNRQVAGRRCSRHAHPPSQETSRRCGSARNMARTAIFRPRRRRARPVLASSSRIGRWMRGSGSLRRAWLNAPSAPTWITFRAIGPNVTMSWSADFPNGKSNAIGAVPQSPNSFSPCPSSRRSATGAPPACTPHACMPPACAPPPLHADPLQGGSPALTLPWRQALATVTPPRPGTLGPESGRKPSRRS